MVYFKDFEGWHQLKPSISQTGNTPTFAEREIWWCSIGVNVGNEMDGKNEEYNRPVLVIRKFSRQVFYGVPMSTKIKDNRFYFPVSFKGRQQSVLISQMRLWDARRMSHRMGKLGDKQFQSVRNAVKDLI